MHIHCDFKSVRVCTVSYTTHTCTGCPAQYSLFSGHDEVCMELPLPRWVAAHDVLCDISHDGVEIKVSQLPRWTRC